MKQTLLTPEQRNKRTIEGKAIELHPRPTDGHRIGSSGKGQEGRRTEQRAARGGRDAGVSGRKTLHPALEPLRAIERIDHTRLA